MRVFTPEGTDLMTITSVEATKDGIVIGGTIMGAMPMKGLIKANELQAGRKFLSFRLILRALKMFFLGK